MVGAWALAADVGPGGGGSGRGSERWWPQWLAVAAGAAVAVAVGRLRWRLAR